ncbi:GH1 family beta-glucosidase [Nocardioides coralli]|uniref:GH1 family beta-glucosidase n=1 Tax=Nocardioides coralli TaxID=2872154 RepID=UPI001CA3A8FA|nr:GH1 family beta-glucosidase [Nocardioides coralli]QZY28519.1 beta-glucosidase [Nocardioides coralli]
MTHPLAPDRLALGVATASYQIEGAVDEDGRSPSIWDEFTSRPGTVRDGGDGSRACDSYHRLDDDLALIEDLGVEWYRFSIAWPRVVPDGTGRVEPRGLDYYDRLVDGLLAQGCRPAATLYHWDLPQRLEEAGGWLSRDTARAFADYAAVVHERLGDRVQLWSTHNEPWCAAYLGYAAGVHAPGRREGGQAHVAAHHLTLGHAWARQVLPADASVGIVLNLVPVWPEDDAARDVARGLDAIRNRIWLDPLVDGAYSDAVLEVAPELRSDDVVRDGDLGAMRGSVDWLGINYYTPMRPALPGRDAPPHPERHAYPGVGDLDLVVREPRTDIGWEVEATGLEELLRTTYERVGVPLVVTENGAAYADQLVDGVVDDPDRIAYLHDHVAATERARDAGADVRGYFVWTLLDNFEWAEGYTKTFGLVHVDRTHQDLPRTRKSSFGWVQRQAAALQRGARLPVTS